MDITGQFILKKVMKDEVCTIDLSELRTGCYLATIEDLWGNKLNVAKVVKE